MNLEYTLFLSFSCCTEATVIWILMDFLEAISCIKSLNDIKKA